MTPAPDRLAAVTIPTVVAIPVAMLDEIVAHARTELPNEACGLIAGDRPAEAGGRALRWLPTRNRAASPFRFDIEPDDLLRASLAIDDRDEVIWGIVHSHVRSPAMPSATDLREAHHPAAIHLIVSLDPDAADPTTGQPGIRAWWLAGVPAEAREIPITPERIVR